METTRLAKLLGVAPTEPRIKWLKESRFAQIVGIEYAGGEWVVKLPSPETFKEIPEEYRAFEVERVNRATEFFHEELERQGVPLPRSYRIYSVDEHPVHVVSYEGDDCAVLVQHDPSRLPAVLHAVFAAISGVLMEGNQRVGIDARLSNFAMRGDNQAVYIDIFPPLIFFEGVHWVHYPHPTDPAVMAAEVKRKFSPFGIMRRFRFDLTAVDPEWEVPFMRSLGALPPQLRDSICAAFQELPDSRLDKLASREKLRLLEGTSEVDTLRELAVRIIPYPAGAQRNRLMAIVFDYTSQAASAGPAAREERLRKFIELMRPFL